ncbi:MAG: hypothetical protein PHY18_04680, partial [Dehalococcoidales bacterium]|nr:hypothetical protein [Dehalococcoidales bacterium]
MRRTFDKFAFLPDNPRNLRILKIVVAASPALFVLLFELFRPSIFEGTRSAITSSLFFTPVVIFAVFFYMVVFSLIKRIQEENLQRNRELGIIN